MSERLVLSTIRSLIVNVSSSLVLCCQVIRVFLRVSDQAGSGVGQVMGDHDTDVAEYLYKEGSNRAGLINLLCKDLTNACAGKVPRVPKVIQSTCELPPLHALLGGLSIIMSVNDCIL